MTRSIPKTPLVLGLLGLIPFWTLAMAVPISGGLGFDKQTIARALATYAAIIVSFLGGVRWGLASAGAEKNRIHFILAVLPSLIAWSLLLLPEPGRLAALGGVALALGPLDALLVGQGLAPQWLGRLRLILSTSAGIALIVGAAGFVLLT